jgi:fatty acid desaturase
MKIRFILISYFSDVPWYADSEWNNVKGQLSTVDRHYGHVHSVIHSIGTHQIHHLFTKVPHYHLGMISTFFLFMSNSLFIFCRRSNSKFS